MDVVLTGSTPPKWDVRAVGLFPVPAARSWQGFGARESKS